MKNGAAKLAKPPAAAAGEAPGGAPGSGLFMERSQSRLSLSASFEALAIYFPCMNSFDEEDAGTGGLRGGGRRVWGGEAAGSALREGCAGPGLRGSPGGGGGHGVWGSRHGGRGGLWGANRALLAPAPRSSAHRVRWAACCKCACARIKDFFTRSLF